MSLFACGSVHQGLDPERLTFKDKSPERREIYLCLAALFSCLLADSPINGGAKIFFLHGDCFFSVHLAEVKCQAKILVSG